MAMALGTSDASHQEWNMADPGIPPGYTNSAHSFVGNFEAYGQGPSSGFGASSFDATVAPGYDEGMAGYDDSGASAAAGSRLFERWGGQGAGGVPASSRLNSFLGADGGGQAGGFDGGFANGNDFNGQYDFSEGGGADSARGHVPLGSRGPRRH